jgi:hypothetical protein
MSSTTNNSSRKISYREKTIYPNRINKGRNHVVIGIWIYFWLLIFEGALRKWIFPGFATPLLIVRDPIAIYIICVVIYHGKFKMNGYILMAYVLTFISFLATLVFSHSNLTVAIYGARIMLIQFPLLFIIGQIFTKADVVKIGHALLYLSPVMTLLMAIQFYSPQSSWVNRGIGGDIAGAGFSGAMGFFRPPGTFSFITGLSSYYSLVAAYVFYFWLEKSNSCRRWLLILSTVCLLASIPLSISRTLFFAVLLSIVFALIAVSIRPKNLYKVLMGLIGASILIFTLSFFDFFQTASEAFGNRFESASSSEGGLQGTLGNRFLGGMVEAVVDIRQETAFWGKGLGMGTNAGAKLMTGKQSFLISEGEWGRLVGEMGLLLGVLSILLRLQLVVELFSKSFNQVKNDNFLPWMLLSFALVNILQGQWAQPNALGFSILTGGLIIAAAKTSV